METDGYFESLKRKKTIESWRIRKGEEETEEEANQVQLVVLLAVVFAAIRHPLPTFHLTDKLPPPTSALHKRKTN
jgi:hypothetical protein